MIKIYGTAASRAARCLWALEELGVPYELIKITGADGSLKGPDYLKINPAGKIPAMTDGEITMTESMAINLYLAQTYGQGSLWPADAAGQAAQLQWTLWIASEAENHVIAIAIEILMRTEAERNHEVIAKATELLAPRLKTLDAGLAGKTWLCGETFTIADLNVACSIMHLPNYQVDLSIYPNVERWVQACLARPAQQKTAAMRKA